MLSPSVVRTCVTVLTRMARDRGSDTVVRRRAASRLRGGGDRDDSNAHPRDPRRACDPRAPDRARVGREDLPDGEARVLGPSRRRPFDRRRRDGRRRRPVRERQDDDHEHDHRHRPTDGGLRRRRRPADRRARRRAARGLARPERRDRLPVLPALTDADRARERHAAPRLRPQGLEARAARTGQAQPRASSASATSSTIYRPSSREASSSGSRSHVPSRPTRS